MRVCKHCQVLEHLLQMVPIVNSVNIGDYLSNPNRLLKKWAIIFLHSWSQILLNNVQRIISHLMACKIWKKKCQEEYYCLSVWFPGESILLRKADYVCLVVNVSRKFFLDYCWGIDLKCGSCLFTGRLFLWYSAESNFFLAEAGQWTSVCRWTRYRLDKRRFLGWLLANMQWHRLS